MRLDINFIKKYLIALSKNNNIELNDELLDTLIEQLIIKNKKDIKNINDLFFYLERIVFILDKELFKYFIIIKNDYINYKYHNELDINFNSFISDINEYNYIKKLKEKKIIIENNNKLSYLISTNKLNENKLEKGKIIHIIEVYMKYILRYIRLNKTIDNWNNKIEINITLNQIFIYNYNIEDLAYIKKTIYKNIMYTLNNYSISLGINPNLIKINLYLK